MQANHAICPRKQKLNLWQNLGELNASEREGGDRLEQRVRGDVIY